MVLKLPSDPAIFHPVIVDKQSANLKMPIGYVNAKDNFFVKAMKDAPVRWEEAEWAANSKVEKGAGIPGEFRLLFKSKQDRRIY